MSHASHTSCMYVARVYFSVQACAYEISVSISALVIHLPNLSVNSVCPTRLLVIDF